MTIPRVLLLTGTPPSSAGVGGIFLNDLCLSYPSESISCFALPSFGYDTSLENSNRFPITSVHRPTENGLLGPGRYVARLTGFPQLEYYIAGLVTLPLHQYIRNVRVPALTKHAVQFARQQRVEIVWAILNHPTLIYLAHRVAAALHVPLVFTVWDPPERFAVELGLDSLTFRILLRDFAKTLSTAVRCSVASEEMQIEYKKRYGIESVVLIHGIHPKLRHPAAKELAWKDRFIIGVAGSLYASREWQALLSALSSVNWRFDGRDVTVRVLGAGLSLRALGKVRVEYLGWRSVEETIDLLSQVDVTYLPYWFDERYSLSARLCFPNKLATYLAAGRPVLFHGPEDSSPAQFFRRFPVGLCCHSLMESQIIGSLRRLATDRELYASAAQAGQRAQDEELNLNVFLRRFAALIGVEESELLSARGNFHSSP